MNPTEVLTGYRLGGHQATVELQKPDSPAIHIEFDVLKLVMDIQAGVISAVILTGTAGDGKTYLAFRILEALGIDRATVVAAQGVGGYVQDGLYIDLDLSAGQLTEARVERLYQALRQPIRLTLICANEGKLSEFEERLSASGLVTPQTSLRINLSERALTGEDAWDKVLRGVLDATFWAMGAPPGNGLLERNRQMLKNQIVAEHLRRYLLLPYLLGEPITVRETLSFLAYALTGDLSSDRAQAKSGADALPNLLFNTAFSEPAGYSHGGRAVPGEKLLWWLFRFDPGATADPVCDLQLLTKLDGLEDVAPPNELLDYWRQQVVIRPDEDSDTAYRQRVATFMRYARRWYALFSAKGHAAYFPFRHFARYLAALATPAEQLEEHIPDLLKGLNLLLSAGQVEDGYSLKLYHVGIAGAVQQAVIYSSNVAVDFGNFKLVSDIELSDRTNDQYLERYPRRLYLCYSEAADTASEQIRLPISLLLWEVLMGAASPAGGFPATLWTKERHTVARFMSALNRRVKRQAVAQLTVSPARSRPFTIAHDPKRGSVTVTLGG